VRERVRRPPRRQFEKRPARRLIASRTGDRLADRGDAAGEVPLGRPDRLIGDPLDRPVRIGEADVPA
jgi:hypothetical protein